MSVHGFMHSVLQHIPNRNFRLVRYYGIYARRKKKIITGFVRHSVIIQKVLSDFSDGREFYCPECGEKMVIIGYCRKPPPKDMSKINEWID